MMNWDICNFVTPTQSDISTSASTPYNTGCLTGMWQMFFHSSVFMWLNRCPLIVNAVHFLLNYILTRRNISPQFIPVTYAHSTLHLNVTIAFTKTPQLKQDESFTEQRFQSVYCGIIFWLKEHLTVHTHRRHSNQTQEGKSNQDSNSISTTSDGKLFHPFLYLIFLSITYIR